MFLFVMLYIKSALRLINVPVSCDFIRFAMKSEFTKLISTDNTTNSRYNDCLATLQLSIALETKDYTKPFSKQYRLTLDIEIRCGKTPMIADQTNIHQSSKFLDLVIELRKYILSYGLKRLENPYYFSDSKRTRQKLYTRTLMT